MFVDMRIQKGDDFHHWKAPRPIYSPLSSLANDFLILLGEDAGELSLDEYSSAGNLCLHLAKPNDWLLGGRGGAINPLRISCLMGSLLLKPTSGAFLNSSHPRLQHRQLMPEDVWV